ncbi:MAG: NAD-dependent epimerase/dehydratase family protein, partial [Bacteroidota bacterium]
GSALCDKLKQEHQVFGLSRHPSADVRIDLLMHQFSLPDVDFVIHTAGLAHKFTEDSTSMHQNNVLATENLLNNLDPSTLKGFIHCSTVAVYGITTGIDINESVSPNPIDSYGDSKYNAEQLISNWCSKNEIPYLILRLPLVVGENAPGNIYRLMDSLKRGRFFLIKDNQSKRSLILLDDLVDLIKNKIKDGITKTGVYNLSDGIGVDFNDFVFNLCEVNGYKKPIMLPFWMAKSLAILNSMLGGRIFSLSVFTKMTQTLTFSSQKANQDLQWSPNPILGTIRTVR